MPLVACLSAELPEPGSFIAFDLAGAPMLVTRGKDGEVRAFLDICPYRGSRLARQPTELADAYGVTDIDGIRIKSQRERRGSPLWQPISEVAASEFCPDLSII